MPNTTAILSVLKVPTGNSWRHSGLLTFESEAGKSSDEEFLKFIPAFINIDLNRKIATVQRRVSVLRKDYVKYMKEGNGKKLKQLINEIKEIGDSLFHKFECPRIFDFIFQEEAITNLVIYTNDPAIPWQWVYHGQTDRFACERFAVGKIFMQDINRAQGEHLAGFLTKAQPKLEDVDTINLLKDRSALILIGDWAGHRREVPRAAKEGNLLLKSFRQRRFGDVKLFRGDDVKFSKAMYEMAKKLKIIHYSGHSSGKGLLPTPNTILSSRDIAGSPGSFDANPVVFLNSCSSGQITEIWEQEANLATAFLARGACGCVVTSLPVSDRASQKFAVAFYEKALDVEKAPPIGEIIRIIRLEQGKDRITKNDLTRLFFDYYGDPRTRLQPNRVHSIRQEQTSTYVGQRVFQELKETLK
jgi:hypothetical protein